MTTFWVFLFYIPLFVFGLNLVVHGVGTIHDKGFRKGWVDVAITGTFIVYWFWVTWLCVEILK